MQTTWSIEHIPASGGASTFASLAVWGFAGLRMQFVNWGVDQASITARSGSIAFDAAQFAYLDKIIVWRNGARFAHFWITGLGLSADQFESRTYTLSGPSWWLGQYAPFYNASIPYTESTSYWAGTYIRIGMADAVAAGAPVGYSQAIEAALNIGCPDVRRAGTILALVQEAARHVPFSSGWWDSSGEVPILYAARRSAAASVSLAIGTDVIETFGITPLPELKLKSVRIQFGWTGGLSYYFDTAGTDADLGGPNRMQVSLTFPTIDAARYAAGNGVAERIFADMSTLPWSGTVNLHATDSVDITPVRPGSALNLTGGRDEWTTMGALVQSVVWSVSPEANDCCTLQLGAPDHLGIQDYFSLSASVGSASGAESPTPPVDPLDPTPGTIDDLNGGTGAAPAGALLTQAQGGTCRISGCPPLDGVETYRRWRTQTARGTLHKYYWLGNEVCAYDPTGHSIWALSGICLWTSNDDTTVTNAMQYVDESSVVHAITAYGVSSLPGAPHSANIGTATLTPTKSEYVGSGECYTGHNTPADSWRATGSEAYTLSNEDTEDTAWTRMLTLTSPSWATSATGTYSARTALTYLRQRYRYGLGSLDGDTIVATSGWTPWGVYEVTIQLQTHPVTAAGVLTDDGAWADLAQRTHLIQGDIDGKAKLDWQEEEPPRGYALRAVLVSVAPITS